MCCWSCLLAIGTSQEADAAAAAATAAGGDAEARRAARRALYADNLAVATSPASRPEEGASLDASLKKNTAFIKKLKEISDKQREALIKELSSLKLGKYIDEGATAWQWRLAVVLGSANAALPPWSSMPAGG